ncbi:hypothetical protein AVEN_55352-1 [Araneus ventricosus]|uniref:G-protein coupled receptors family 1 profile domain-containing protein n=1 Tax=Araneus ventricosus TaxID=182803 RepID=A0A4Y2DC37_ARAVE|nr:hypothetical protein AVEN_55352-1 [Araneus ventricosus]
MDSVLYSWLAAAAVAPFVVILSCWTLAVFRSYRPDWRLLDIFLYALVCMEVASALFSFGYSILEAIRPALEAPCRFIIWGLTATRVFHLSAVTSLLLDRALASKWPNTYRSSVRHSQVRYHVIVLAIISIFVGVTSVFARLPSAANTCSLHPLDWDIKFSAFLSCVYALLLITGFGCCFAVQAGRFRSRSSYRTSCSRNSGTTNSSGSCDETRDLEWAVVASICWLSYMVNHGPYLSPFFSTHITLIEKIMNCKICLISSIHVHMRPWCPNVKVLDSGPKGSRFETRFHFRHAAYMGLVYAKSDIVGQTSRSSVVRRLGEEGARA